MDISRQTNNDPSMYLSFDSTISSAAFKTLNDISTVSGIGETSIEEQRTLEKIVDYNDSLHANQMITIKKSNGAVLPSPMRPFCKKILQEYKAVCSTPTKEQLMRSVDVARGSDAEHCIDLGLAFLGVEDEKHAYFPPSEDNKENAHPESGDGSTLSASSSVEIVTSVIERKMMTVSITGDESLLTDAHMEDIDAIVDADATPRAKAGVEKIEQHEKALPNTTTSVKIKRSILAPRNTRKTICEPNLNANRPSRIFPPKSKNRQSVASFSSQQLKPKVDSKISTEIPKLLHMSEKATKTETITSSSTNDPTNKLNPRKSIAVGFRGRSSMLPTTQGEKRPLSFTQRMSIVVKTTLNSPARKVARKSVLLPTKISAVLVQQPKGAITKKPTATRNSIMPTLAESISKTKASATKNRQSQLPNMPPSQTKTKSECTFVCTVCACTFRIKSLLDAHKRSHEDGGTIPFNKKPIINSAVTSAGSTGSLFSNTVNQCKYCDKKFAIQRALHIHLLQNCAKIPPGDKRKLQFTEMNHVEKAQLPVFAHGNHTNILKKSYSNLSTDSMTAEKKEVSNIANELVTAVDNAQSQPMAPPQPVASKIKKLTAYSGVYRTPNKSVPCYICKQSFKSVLDYTNHSMTMHAKAANNASENTQ